MNKRHKQLKTYKAEGVNIILHLHRNIGVREVYGKIKKTAVGRILRKLYE